MHFGRTIFRFIFVCLFVFSTPEMFPTIYGHCDPQTSRSTGRRDIAARNDYKVRGVTVLRQRVRLKII